VHLTRILPRSGFVSWAALWQIGKIT